MSFLREPNYEPIPGYRLIEPLGSGGFGEAWKCEAPGGIQKAIKFVFGNLNSLDVDGARAEQEQKALNRVKEVRHPFVLQMDRIEEVDGELVIVMELADKSLHDLYEECQRAGLVGIPRDDLLRYMRDAAEALDHMFDKHNLQHLDIKPRNLFLVSDRVKVADFGLVRHLSGISSVMGGVTPLYAAPETFSGKISSGSDQYSLAIVYQELLTGQRPFNGKNVRAITQQHLNDEPEVRALPEAERPVVARALAKDPTRRFPNCLAFVRALYMARSRSHAEVIIPNPPSGPGEAKRPKTMADTMEDMLLEQMPAEEDCLEPVDLGEVGKEEVSKLGLTIALPQTGALKPTLVIGLGNFGRRALMELRGRLLDRFGALDKAPLIRFLYIDTDLDAIKQAQRGDSELAFRTSEVYHLPLQPVAHYRRRQLDQLNDWLPREKLYGLPRSLKTQGSRALGRLAFTDNYQRLLARLKREIQQASHPDVIYQTVSQTGLALRDNVPRVCVLAGATGGASGYLTDLGFTLRRLLQQLRQPEATLTGYFLCGAPEDPATPRSEQANLYATLTELNHFADPSITFSAQYGTDGPRLVSQGPAYDQLYLLSLNHRTPECRRDVMAHLGSYLFHELTTPLSIKLERHRLARAHSDTLPFRSLGTFGVWFPRGLLLRLAGREALQLILDEWQTAGDPTARSELEAAKARLLAEPELAPEALGARIAEMASEQLEGTPNEALTRVLVTLEEQAQQMVAQDDPGAWARQAVSRVRDWLGTGLTVQGNGPAGQTRGTTFTVGGRKSRLTKALEEAAAGLAEEWDKRFLAATMGLMEHPGRRLAVAETAMNLFIRYCDDSAAVQGQRIKQQLALRTRQAEEQLQQALESCITGAGGFSLFGGKHRRLLRVFMDHLAAFGRQCLAEDLATSVAAFYTSLRGRLGDHFRDLTLCRQRLRHVLDTLEQMGNDNWTPTAEEMNGGSTVDLSPSPALLTSTESFWETIRVSATARVVLPEGQEDLEKAAHRFLSTLTTDQWVQLDQAFQDQVLNPQGGLFKACLGSSDLMRYLVNPLLNHAVTCLGAHLPITDVAQVELALGESEEGDLATRLQAYHAQAAPVLSPVARVSANGSHGGVEAPAAPGEEQQSYLLIPASDAGKAYAEEAQRLLPGIQLITVPGQADLMFCREQPALRVEDLERLLRTSRKAYEDAAPVPTSSPHARFDIQDWTPLDP